jgi:hypothetical protein
VRTGLVLLETVLQAVWVQTTISFGTSYISIPLASKSGFIAIRTRQSCKMKDAYNDQFTARFFWIYRLWKVATCMPATLSQRCVKLNTSLSCVCIVFGDQRNTSNLTNRTRHSLVNKVYRQNQLRNFVNDPIDLGYLHSFVPFVYIGCCRYLPRCSEAQHVRMSFFLQSLTSPDMPRFQSVPEMHSFSVMTPYYNETVLFFHWVQSHVKIQCVCLVRSMMQIDRI